VKKAEPTNGAEAHHNHHIGGVSDDDVKVITPHHQKIHEFMEVHTSMEYHKPKEFEVIDKIY